MSEPRASAGPKPAVARAESPESRPSESKTRVAAQRAAAARPRGRPDAMHRAQLLAWAPVLFQAAWVLRERGLLRELIARVAQGASVDELATATDTSPYGVTVLLEAGLATDLVVQQEGRFRPTALAYLVERDPMTRANMNFVQDVCYRAMGHLGEAIASGKPAGLAELGPWSTVYAGLAELGEPARTSWLEFDHFYSDDSFPLVLPQVFSSRPARVLDVGGNTGKFALACLGYDPDVRITVADLPGQLESCRREVEQAGDGRRVSYHPVDLLALDAALPAGHDVIWMSQFLCCFSEVEVVHILRLARSVMGPATRLLIMDNFWDRQQTRAAEVVLQAASLYFTCVANGNSRLYDSGTLRRCVERAGLEIVDERHGVGLGHSLLECRGAPGAATGAAPGGR
jgi:hypothetical protein